jgi:protein phosphatase
VVQCVNPDYPGFGMISFSSQTDVGRHRLLNEDTVLAGGNLFVVCDGMGGYKAGEVASRVASEVIAAFVERSGRDTEITWPYGFQPALSFDGNRLRTAVKLANRAVFRKGTSSEDYTGMGTTVVAMVASRSRPVMTYAHVGDSRIYLVRGRGIEQLTRDDSWANVWDATDPDNPARKAMKHVLTKALGAEDDVDFEVRDRELRDGDVMLLCSDGLTNMVSDERMLEIITAREADLDRACGTLLAEANAAGGRDNISAILVRYDGRDDTAGAP